MNRISICLLSFLLISACINKEQSLPIIGDRTYPDGTVDRHEIRAFQLVNQLGDTISNKDFEDKIYLIDFFFTSCPSICPKVTKQMLRLYDHVNEYDDVLLVSTSIDPVRDTPEILKKYADNMNIDHGKWLFLTGDKDEIMDLANEDYFVTALVAPDVPGGFDHSGKIILLDKSSRIRGFCEGTESKSVSGMMKMIDQLRSEYD